VIVRARKIPLTTWLRFEHEPRKVRAVRFFSYANIEHEHESDGKGTQILVLVLVSYGRPISRKTRTFAVSRTSTSTSTEKRNTPILFAKIVEKRETCPSPPPPPRTVPVLFRIVLPWWFMVKRLTTSRAITGSGFLSGRSLHHGRPPFMVVVRGEAKRSHVRKYRTTMVKEVRVLFSRRTCEPIGTTTTTTTTTEKRNTT